MNFCHACGSKLETGDAFCSSCGEKILAQSGSPVSEGTGMYTDMPSETGEKRKEPPMDTSMGDGEAPAAKTKRKKVILFSSLVGVLAICTVVFLWVGLPLLTATEIDLLSYYAPTVTGYEGHGTTAVTPRVEAEELVQRIVTASRGRYSTEEVQGLVQSIRWEPSKAEKLTNGDALTFLVNYDKKLAKKLGLRFKNETIAQTVTGLGALQDYDVFKGINFSFAGYDGVGVLHYRKESTQQNMNIRFGADKESGLKNGDRVTVTANLDPDVAGQQGYKVENTQKVLEVKDLMPITQDVLFEHVTVIFSGNSPEIVAAVENTDPPFAGIVYQVSQDKGLREGDTVSVSASWPGSEAVKESSATSEFVVSTKRRYITAYEELSSSQKETIEEAGKEILSRRVGTYGADKEALQQDFWQPRGMAEAQFPEDATVESAVMELDSVYVLNPKEEGEKSNEIVFLYDVQITFADKGIAEGKRTTYFALAFEDITQDEAGNINLNRKSGKILLALTPAWYSLRDLYEEAVGKKTESAYINEKIIMDNHSEKMAIERSGPIEPIPGQGVLFFSSSRYLIEADLRGMRAENMGKARNEIFARHGLTFNDPELQAHAQHNVNGYVGTIAPEQFDDSVLNDYERYNIQFILEHEKNLPKSPSPQLEPTVESTLPENSAQITPEEALRLAEIHWNYTPGQVDEKNGFERGIRVNPTVEIEGQLHYAFTLRWYVEGARWSSIDDIYVNANTGDCIARG